MWRQHKFIFMEKKFENEREYNLKEKLIVYAGTILGAAAPFILARLYSDNSKSYMGETGIWTSVILVPSVFCGIVGHAIGNIFAAQHRQKRKYYEELDPTREKIGTLESITASNMPLEGVDTDGLTYDILYKQKSTTSKQLESTNHEKLDIEAEPEDIRNIMKNLEIYFKEPKI